MVAIDGEKYDDFEINENHLDLLNSVSKKNKTIIRNIETRKPFYIYNQAEEIIKVELDPRFLNADTDTNNRGRILFFYGDFDSGKSYLLKYAASLMKEKYPQYWNAKNEHFPIIILDLEKNINTSKQFLLFILDKLGRPIDPKQLKQWEKTHVEETRLTDKLIKLLEQYKTRILILDECQRLLKAKNPDIPNIFESIKDLTTKFNWNGDLRTHFILCGTRDGVPLLEAADWIQGRTHSLKLLELSLTEYGTLLWIIYEDYLRMGLSKNWNFAINHPDSGDLMLNPDLALFLYRRTGGKVGLTVELVRSAVLRALRAGRNHPTEKDYKMVIIEGLEYEIEEIEEKLNDDPNQIHIVIGFHDRKCKIDKCKRSKNPYKSYRALINHYKLKHPKVILLNREGDQI